MWCRSVFVGLLVVGAHAFSPAVIRWGAHPKMAVVPSGQALPATLTISDRTGRTLVDEIPQFQPKLDNTIVWATPNEDLCVEAHGDQNGDPIRVNHCNGGKNQLWNFLPLGRDGRTLLQLRDTARCIHVSDNVNGSPIVLQDCEEKQSEFWTFEDTVQQQGSLMRYVMMSLIALAGAGVLSVGAWLWQSRPKARVVAASQAALSVDPEVGVSMTMPFASDSLNPVASVATHRGGDVSMEAAADAPAAEEKKEEVRAGVKSIDEMDMHGSVVTLSRYMIEQAQANPELQTMESLMTAIQMACKQIASLVSRSGIQDLTGLQEGGGSVNIQGEEQKKLDVISNNVMKNCLRFSGKVGVVGSEEEDDPVLIEDSFDGRYTAVFDPLDGSSNIDAAISTGTIFGIFEDTGDEDCLIPNSEELSESQVECLVQTLRPGKKLRAAGYCMYSSSTIFVFTMGNGTHGFTLDPNIGEFVLTHPNIQIPKRGKIYSINESNTPEWPEALQEYINNLKNGKGESGVKYTSRYIGSMVGDIHRTLLYGGIFGYPGDDVNPNGKLRLLYEGAPMSFIVEQAGGKCYTGSQRIMEIVPQSVHQRVPCFLGSPEDVDEVLGYYKQADIAKNYVY